MDTLIQSDIIPQEKEGICLGNQYDISTSWKLLQL